MSRGEPNGGEMKRRTLIAALIFALFAAPMMAPADDAMVDKPLGVYFLYAGVNARIDSIEVSKTRTNNPALKDMEDDSNAQGAVVIQMTVQNPSSNKDIAIPGSAWGWELADGSQRDMGGADHEYAGKSLVDIPDSLHPKQTLQLTYVFAWNGSPITKLFLKRGSGTEDNVAGAQYVRFQIKPSDIKQLQ
jgi:hypothetical protein